MSNKSARCFPLPERTGDFADQLTLRDSANGKRIEQWIEQHASSAKQWLSDEQYALAHLIPLLLCGEQSAQLVFNQEITRLFSLNDPQNIPMLNSLAEVEADEHRHDRALQAVFDSLPKVEKQLKIQRQAQLFYSKLGRGQSRCQHFIKIATLDTCVTQIMHEFEHSLLGPNHPFARLCGLIKKDEAKHVYIAKHYAQAMGATKEMLSLEQQAVSKSLHQLLATQEQHFNRLGVDLNKLFNTLEDKWR